MSELIRLVAQGKRVQVVGGVNEILRLLGGGQNLQDGQPTDVPEFFGFASWNDVLWAVKDDELPEMASHTWVIACAEAVWGKRRRYPSC